MKKFKKDKHTLIPVQETNFDMVRKMDDAELAFFIVHQTGCDKCDNFKNEKCSSTDCGNYWMKWGKSPATPIDLDNL